MAIIMDGKALAAKMKEGFRGEVGNLPKRPGLAVVLVGENPASKVYVRNKEKDCEECGIASQEYKLPEETTESMLLELIDTLNRSSTVDGILVQLPLPKQIDEKKIIGAIAPDKDVDAFHPVNVGHIMTGDFTFLPCTPAGIMRLLDEYKIDVAGKNCVVLGRSNIVGKPMAMLLLHRNGTVTICHSKTADIKAEARRADILVSAIGKTGIVTGDMIKPGAVVIDVAMNRNAEGKLCGDCVFGEVEKAASYITPVPGGVGPMTRVMLMQNTIAAAKAHQGIK
jgi:methylenetetrahydrofolate dehydrogenase (NADP+)/methenyltetrahydrofolate cyclohydrolase